MRPILKKTPYKLWRGRKLNISYFKVFGYKCFIVKTKDNLEKFDAKTDVGIFLGYSTSSKAYRVLNKRSLVVEESMHVNFDEIDPSCSRMTVEDFYQLSFKKEDPHASTTTQGDEVQEIKIPENGTQDPQEESIQTEH